MLFIKSDTQRVEKKEDLEDEEDECDKFHIIVV